MFVAPFVLALALTAGEAPPVAARPKVPVPAAKAKAALPVARPVMVGQLGKGLRAIPPPMPALITAPGGSPAASVGGVGDEAVLKAVKLQTTDDALLDFFRKRTPPAPAKETLVELVKKLGGKDPAVCDAAQAHLIAVGQAAVPLLRQAANNVDDVEGSSRAKVCLQHIEGAAAANLVVNAARLLAARRPTGAAEALIGYLPYAEDDGTFQEVEAALVAVAMRDGKPDPAILKALRDKVSIRRGAAAAVLCQAGGAANYSAVRPLLKDSRPSVRLKAALGLVGAFDSEAIPVLIDLLADLTPRLRQQAEDYLTGLAGEWAVSGPKGNDLMSRRLRRDVWAAWWKNADGGRLLDEFQSRTPTDADHDTIVALIAKLDDPVAATRETRLDGTGRPGQKGVLAASPGGQSEPSAHQRLRRQVPRQYRKRHPRSAAQRRLAAAGAAQAGGGRRNPARVPPLHRVGRRHDANY